MQQSLTTLILKHNLIVWLPGGERFSTHHFQKFVFYLLSGSKDRTFKILGCLIRSSPPQPEKKIPKQINLQITTQKHKKHEKARR